MKSTKTLRNALRIIAACALLPVIQVALCGCANWGSIRYSPEVTQMFRTYRILPDHRYYYTGLESMPYAIVAIDDRYSLVSRVWHEIDPRSEQYKNMVDNIWIQFGGIYDPRGALIVDQSGKQVGIWYSSWTWTGVKTKDDNQLIIYSPYEPGMNNDGDSRFMDGH
jgi:hypothetical protein